MLVASKPRKVDDLGMLKLVRAHTHALKLALLGNTMMPNAVRLLPVPVIHVRARVTRLDLAPRVSAQFEL